MNKMKVAVIIFMLGLLVFLKIYLNSIPRISEPISNIVVFLGFLIAAIIFGMSKLKEDRE
ncbi:hypothetical protein [Solibacillus cecembensis]|uniref:hypothetical protein n=1 Tax=Solibacillus cecembensis TaxID=459347 RepID=UPI000717455E